MKAGQMIKEILRAKNSSIIKLSKELNKPSSSYISNKLLRENGMKVETLMEMTDALGYDICLRDKQTGALHFVTKD